MNAHASSGLSQAALGVRKPTARAAPSNSPRSIGQAGGLPCSAGAHCHVEKALLVERLLDLGCKPVDVLKALERRRIEMIVSLVEAGKTPPVPRKPLAAADPLWIACDLGLSARVAALLGNSAN